MLPRFYGGDMTIAQPESLVQFAKTSIVATRLAFAPAGTPPAGVTTDTTAPKSGAQGWTATSTFGFNDRGTANAGSANPWLWRGGNIGTNADSAKYRIVCTVGGTIAARGYAYDGANIAVGNYVMKQSYSGGFRGSVNASPDDVLNVSGAVMVGTFTDVDNVGYIDLVVVTSIGSYYCWCGLDFIASSSTSDLPTLWAY